MIKRNNDYWIDLSPLPKKSDRINWKNAVGFEFEMGYQKEKLQAKIHSYNKKDRKTMIELIINNKLYKVNTHTLTTPNIAIFFKKPFYNIGDIVNNFYQIEDINVAPAGISYITKCIKCQQSSKKYIEENELKRGIGGKYVHGSLTCPNDSVYQYKHLRQYFLDEEIMKKISPYSHKKMNFKCPDCGEIKMMQVSDLTLYGLPCVNCSDKTSLLEKFMASYFRVKKIKYTHQKQFDGLKLKRFDFYLHELKTVVEIHGLQHYEEIDFYNKHNTKESDTIKKQFCIDNNIKYIVIDGRKHNINYIRESISKSELESISDEELVEIMRGINIGYYDVESIIYDYEHGMSVERIMKKHDISMSTVYKYVRHFGSKKVREIFSNTIYNSVREAAKDTRTSEREIRKCCKGLLPYTIGYDELECIWEYYKEEEVS